MKTNPTPFPPVHPLPVIQTAPPDETPPAAAPLPPPVQAAEEHFRRYLFSVIARLVAQLDANRESFAAVLAGLPFVDAYQTHLLSQAPPDVPLLALPAWWDEQVAAFERGYSGHLPLRALVAEAGLTPGAVRLLLAAGLVEEDVRFGSLFALLQEPLAARRPCVGLLTWLLGAPADAGPLWATARALTEAGLLAVENPGDIRPEWLLRVPAHVWDAISGQTPGQPAPGVSWQHREAFPLLDDLILPDGLQRQVAALPDLIRGGQAGALILRGMTGSGRRTVLGAVARALGRDLLLCDRGHEQQRALIGPLATLLGALPGVGRHDENALVALQPLEQEVGLQIGVAVVGVAHVGALGHQRVALVQQQDDVQLLGPREDLIEVALRLADVLVDHRRQIDAVDVHLQRPGQRPRSQRLARAARPAEHGPHAARQGVAKGRAGVGQQRLAPAAARLQQTQVVHRQRVDHQRRPAVNRGQRRGQRLQCLPVQHPRRLPGVLHGVAVAAVKRGEGHGRLRRALDQSAGQQEAAGQRRRAAGRPFGRQSARRRC